MMASSTSRRWPWSGTPLLYLAIRFLFKFVLKIFYSSIVIENPEFVPSDGMPWSVMLV